MTERLGPDAEAMRSSSPFRILKWVRTEQVAQFETEESTPQPEHTSNGENIKTAEEAAPEVSS